MSIGTEELRSIIAAAIEGNLYPPYVNMIDGESDDPEYDRAADAVIEVLRTRGLLNATAGESS